MKKIALLFIILITLTTSMLSAQVFLNLDFEKASPSGIAKGWYQGGEGYSVLVDTTVFYSGKKSLCIQRVGSGNFGVATSSFPVETARGKKLVYSGYIKTENLTEGYAGLWWRVDGRSGVLNFDNMSGRGPNGTSDWKKYTIEFKIDENPTNINFGVLLPGNGKAWFDNLQIELEGNVYEQNEPEKIVLSTEQIDWLRGNINIFDSAEPSTSNSDLGFLKEMIGDAKIVALGEGTHGTKEFFKMKHKITKYLAEEMGFSVFAIEANMPEAEAVNDYVLNGNGDPRKVLAGLYFWTWNTQEVLDMIEWMREFNKSGKGRIEFKAFDMQTPDVAIANTLDFLSKYDSAFYKIAQSKYTKIIGFSNEIRKSRSYPDNYLSEPFLESAEEIYKHMIENRNKYLSLSDEEKVDWVLQNSRIVVQGIQAIMRGQQSRDESMALNTKWILDNMKPEAKIVLWAHNGHVAKRDAGWKPMGSHLNKMYGNKMIVFGFGFNKGEYTAVGQKGLGIYSTSLPEPGSLEWLLNKLKTPRFFLDLRNVKESPLSVIFNNEIDFRSIGAMAMDYAFNKTIITDDFDVLIYFDETSPSECFGYARRQ